MGVPDGVSVTTADSATAAANTAVVITYAAKDYGRHALVSLSWSYSAAPVAGGVKVEDGSGNTVFQLDITAAGPNSIIINNPMLMSENKAMIVTLAAGGGSAVGKLNAQHYVL